MYIPTDIQNLICSFLPTKCDWCCKDCNYEIIDYRVKIFLDKDRLDDIKENSYICRLCKISNFNFDNKHLWVRNLPKLRERSLRMILYEYNCYGVIVEESLYSMTDISKESYYLS